MTYCASPDAPVEVLSRHAHRRRCEAAWWVAHGNITAEQARTVAVRCSSLLEAADADRQPRLCAHLAALAESEAARTADAAAAAARFTPLAEHAAEVDYRAEHRAARAARSTAALDALTPAPLVLDLTPEETPPAPSTSHNLPPPGQAVRCSPLAAHAPPTATARGRSRRLGTGTASRDRRR